MHIFEYNTRCSNGAMNADYNGASEGGGGPQAQEAGASSSSSSNRIESVAIVSRVVTEYLLYLCICVEQ